MGDRDLGERALSCITAGDSAAMASLLDAHPGLLTGPVLRGRGLVGLVAEVLTCDHSIPHQAGTPSQEAILALVLERGADANLPDEGGWTALHSACMGGHARLARTLLEAGASTRAAAGGNPDALPLCWALFYAHAETAELVAAHDLAPDGLRTAAALGRSVAGWVDGEGELRPGATAGRGFYRPLGLFPEWDAPLDRQTSLDEALTWASRNGRLSAMAELLELGAGVNSNAYRGTPLLWATYANRLDAMRWLVERGADPSLPHDFGGLGHGQDATALHLAAQFGALEAIGLLLELGADPSVRDSAHGGCPRDWASACGQPAAAELLSRAQR